VTQITDRSRNWPRINNDPRSEVCRHIFVGGHRAHSAWWVPNGDSKNVAKNMSAVQSFAP